MLLIRLLEARETIIFTEEMVAIRLSEQMVMMLSLVVVAMICYMDMQAMIYMSLIDMTEKISYTIRMMEKN